MSKAYLARQLSQRLDTSLSRARSFVDDVGEQTARRVTTASTGSTSTLRRLAVSGAIGGGTVLGVSQRRRLTELADENDRMENALRELVEDDDLDADERADLVDAMIEAGAFRPGGDDDQDGSLLPSMPDVDGALGSTIQIVVLVIVLVIVLDNALDGGVPR